jgi:hypothetical protein
MLNNFGKKSKRQILKCVGEANTQEISVYKLTTDFEKCRILEEDILIQQKKR